MAWHAKAVSLEGVTLGEGVCLRGEHLGLDGWLEGWREGLLCPLKGSLLYLSVSLKSAANAEC